MGTFLVPLNPFSEFGRSLFPFNFSFCNLLISFRPLYFILKGNACFNCGCKASTHILHCLSTCVLLFVSNSLMSNFPQLRTQLDDAIAGECPFCGELMIREISLPFISSEEAQQVSSWEIRPHNLGGQRSFSLPA